MNRIKLYLTLLTSFVAAVGAAQELAVISKGNLNGKFSEKIGSSGGSSIQVEVEPEFVTLNFSGEESWAGSYLINTDENGDASPIDLSVYKYIQFTVRSTAPTAVEKIGFGKAGEKSELIKQLALTNDWRTVVLELPKGMEKQQAFFSVVTVAKSSIQIAEVKYTNTLPEGDNSILTLVSAPAERLDDVTYIYSEGFENGAPSGYSGEKNGASMKIDDKCMEQPYRGKYCVKIAVDDSEGWRALFLQYSGKWTNQLTEDFPLPDLSEYKKLVFYARSPDKNYMIPEVGFGGKTTMFSQEQRNIVYVEVGKKWGKHEIDLRSLDKASVNDVMMLLLNEGTLFLDEIRFEK